MRKLLIILSLLWFQSATSQTAIPATTTVQQLQIMKAGNYSYKTSIDTAVIFTLDSPYICPKVDTAAIKALKICPICPVCPTIPPQRAATSLTWDAINKRWTIGYNDGTKTFL